MKPYAFTFWQNSGAKPAYLQLADETLRRNLANGFNHVHLDYESCLEWVPERDALWEMSAPATKGRSVTSEGRRWAIFTGMLRVALIYHHGGLWVDADTIAFPQISLLADVVIKSDLVATEYEDARIANSVIGGRAGSAFFKRYWHSILAMHADKRRAGDLTAKWGEYGDRLIGFLLMEGPDWNSFIIPFGMLIQFDTNEGRPIFAKAELFEKRVPVTALGMMFFNNAIPDDMRTKPVCELLAENSVLSRAYSLGMDDSLANSYLLLADSRQLWPFNRARRIRKAVEEKTRILTQRDIFKQKLSDRNQIISKLRNRLSDVD